MVCLFTVMACSGPMQEVTFTSTPPGATVTIGEIRVKTPATVALSLDSDHVAHLDIIFLPYRLLVGSAWAFYLQSDVSLIPNISVFVLAWKFSRKRGRV